jgi:hypothetical protein
MPKGIGYAETGEASKMGYFSKENRAARKKKKATKKKKKLDTKRKESRRGKQRQRLRDAGVTEKKIDTMLPWGKI